MKKKINTIIKREEIYELSAEEAKIVKYCLDYCWHRITKHGKTFLSEEDVDALRKQFN
jgi:hypothetical protein